MSILLSETANIPVRISCLNEILETFAQLGASGAMSGLSIEPWKSSLSFKHITECSHGRCVFALSGCHLSDQSLIVLTNLLLAKQDLLFIHSVVVESQGKEAKVEVRVDKDDQDLFPSAYAKLPFILIDEQPESGAYTFQAELQQAADPVHVKRLDSALNSWVRAVVSGGYEMASISPTSSYVEPAQTVVIAFDTTLEWGIFKLRADPGSVNGIVNIFAAFHQTCQPLVSLTIM